MPLPPYPAAQEAANRIYPHFARHLATIPLGGERAPLASQEALATMIDAAFWASLRREEGYVPKISLAWVSPDQVKLPLLLDRPIDLTPQMLTRVAPSVERPGIHLGVWHDGDALRVWGMTRTVPPFCFVLEVVAPGLLVIKHGREEDSGKFVNVAVLQGEEIKIVDQRAAKMPDCPDLLMSLLGLESQFSSQAAVSVLIQLAVSMREHGRGGALLVVPSESETWQESIMQPIMYGIRPAFHGLAKLMMKDPEHRARPIWQDALRRAVDAVGGLTAVDGATIITDKYEVLAFGAKIVRRRGSSTIAEVLLTEPIEGAVPAVLEPSQIGGTRHLSAAQFTQDQRNAIAMVASQDGHFTAFGWSPCEQKVHAHRIETLLL